jgi:hypothetical protein
MFYGGSQVTGLATSMQAMQAFGAPVQFSVVPAADGRRQTVMQIAVPVPEDASVTEIQAAADAAYHAAQLMLSAPVANTTATASAAAAAAGRSSSRRHHAAGVKRRLDFSSSPAGLLSQYSSSQLACTPYALASQQRVLYQGSRPGRQARGSGQCDQEYGQLGQPMVDVFDDPEEPHCLLVHTGTPYNPDVHELMNSVSAWWNKPIKCWRIHRSEYQQVKEGLEEIGFDCPDEPPAEFAAAGGA